MNEPALSWDFRPPDSTCEPWGDEETELELLSAVWGAAHKGASLVRGTRSSPELHGAGDIGHLSSGVVGRCDAPSNGMIRASVLYSTGSQDTIVEPVGYQQIRHPSLSPSME